MNAGVRGDKIMQVCGLKEVKKSRSDKICNRRRYP